MPLNIDFYADLCTEKIDLDTFQALVAGVLAQRDCTESWRAQIKAAHAITTSESKIFDNNQNDPIIPIMNAQKEDPVIAKVIEYVRNQDKKSPSDNKVEQDKVLRMLLLQKKNSFLDENDILHRRSGSLVQLVLPSSLKPLIYDHLHVKMGHLGPERVFQLARRRVYWPKMFLDIQNFVQTQCSCIVQMRPYAQQSRVFTKATIQSSQRKNQENHAPRKKKEITAICFSVL